MQTGYAKRPQRRIDQITSKELIKEGSFIKACKYCGLPNLQQPAFTLSTAAKECGISVPTLKKYLIFALSIEDFNNSVPTEGGDFKTTYRLSHYQVSVVKKIADSLERMRSWLNGSKYTEDFLDILRTKKAQKALGYEAYKVEYESALLAQQAYDSQFSKSA